MRRATRWARSSRTATISTWSATTWKRSPQVPDRAPLTEVLVGFARELRGAGLTVGTGDVLTYCSATAALDPTDLVDVYWAGRATLVSKPDDIPGYDATFRRYFLAEGGPAAGVLTLRATAAAQAEAAAFVMPATEPQSADKDEDPAVLGWMASDVDA